jgi:hypothetical protein
MKLKKYVLNAAASVALMPLGAQFVSAEETLGTTANNTNLILRMNNDSTDNEGLRLQQGFNGTYSDFATIFNDGAAFSGPITDINDDVVNIGENLDVDGDVDVSGDLDVTGATSLSSTLLVEGATTINDTLIVDVGATTFDVNGTRANLTVQSGGNSSALNVEATTVSLTNNGSGITSAAGRATVTGTTRTTITGGTSSMLVDNSGVSFSGTGGAPLRVTGVSDGFAPFDAVNVRQLQQMDGRLSAAIAGTMAMTQLPSMSAGENFAFGIAVGHYNSQNAFALGGAIRVADTMTLRGAVQHSSTGGTGGAIGAGWSW